MNNTGAKNAQDAEDATFLRAGACALRAGGLDEEFMLQATMSPDRVSGLDTIVRDAIQIPPRQ